MIKLFDSNMNEIIFSIDDYQTKLFPLDNFSPYGLEMGGEKFLTSEHAFQYLKFINTNKDISTKIKNSKLPDDARMIAHENKKYRLANWSDIKYDNMEYVLRLKVEQNPKVKKALLDTKNYLIAECCIDEDTDWGIDNNNCGNNHLGRIWMKIRDEYLNNDLIINIDKLHTTELGKERIKKNLGISGNVVSYLKSKILDIKAIIYKKGKNWYCEIDNIIITINSYNYVIITAHKI